MQTYGNSPTKRLKKRIYGVAVLLSVSHFPYEIDGA